MKYAAAVCNVRDEQRDIAEWIAFHLAVGFDEVIVVNDHSEDRTIQAVKSVPAQDRITLIDWTAPSIQVDMYRAVLDAYRNRFRWLAFIDADEALYPSDGGDIRALLERYEAHPALAVFWRLYGSSGLRSRPSAAGMVASFVHRAEESCEHNRSVKSIVQPAMTARPITSHMFETAEPTVDETMAPLVGDGTFYGHAAPCDRVRINHYHVKSYADFRAKRARGTFGPKYGSDDAFASGWSINDRNDVFDPSAVRYVPGMLEFL